uniref:Uncharacterized protein n=1 Tax=Eutreptiella gymnastica TaxID=73025 RepID=A0A7S4FDQ6_9EUGL
MYADLEDKEYWRNFEYSAAALPWLLGILLTFITLISLSIWLAHSQVWTVVDGVPRDMVVEESNGEISGISAARRNMRLATSILAISLAVITAVIYAVHVDHHRYRKYVNYLLAACLLATGILAVVCFGLDVGREDDAENCVGSAHATTVCESLADIALLCTIFDALLAAFLFISGFLVAAFTRSGDWCRIRYQNTYHELYSDRWPGLVANGVSRVRKTLTFWALFLTIVFGVTLLCATLALPGQQYQWVDSNNRLIETPGWPVRCTIVRYALCTLVILTIAFNLIPLNSRVVSYTLGFLYVVASAMAIAAFGLDVAAIVDATATSCPAGVTCDYTPYVTTAVIDIVGSILLAGYVFWEYYWAKREQQLDVEPTDADPETPQQSKDGIQNGPLLSSPYEA